tara:strand:+ start:4489 stop:5277 length:789 start_codon:yes stop_codon:yes gene_type:complete
MTNFVIDNQIQTLALERVAGQIEFFEGAIPSPENTLAGIGWHTLCPWQITLSLDVYKHIKVSYGQKYDTEFRAHMNAPGLRLREVSNIGAVHRLFLENKMLGAVGWSVEQASTATLAEMFDFDGSDYSVTYKSDWRYSKNKERMLELTGGETYVSNVMATSRPAFPGEVEWIQGGSEVCVKFVPSESYGGYNAWENGLHIQTQEAGAFTILKRGTGKNYIILTEDGQTSTGLGLDAGRPYTLVSPSISIMARDNLILHINEK